MEHFIQRLVAAAGTLAGVSALIAACSSSTTTTTCLAGSVACGGTCTVVARDPDNCGACGTKCGAGEVCSQGACSTSCGGGTALCNAACVDTKSDPANCGACGKKCDAGSLCSKGACAPACAASETACGNACVDTTTDRANCGACGTTCKSGEVCTAGQCTLSCQQGLTLCTKQVPDGGVVDAASDVADVGVVDAADSGTALGASYCANLQSDDANCGTCGQACGNGTQCVAGACAVTCGNGTTKCGNACKDTLHDPQNCGACGNVCSAGRMCISSQCVLSSTHKIATFAYDYASSYTGCGDNSNYATLNVGMMTYDQCEAQANYYGAQYMGQAGYFVGYNAPYATNVRWVGEADANNGYVSTSAWTTVTAVPKSSVQYCILAYANGTAPGNATLATLWASANGKAYLVADYGVISEKVCFTNALAAGARPLNPWMFSASTKSQAHMVENHQNHGSTQYTGLGTYANDGGCNHTYRCLVGYNP